MKIRLPKFIPWLFTLCLLLPGAPLRAENALANLDRWVWDLTRLFPDFEAWEAEFAAVQEIIPDLEKHRGRLGESPEVLFEAIELRNETFRRMGDLWRFSSLLFDQDVRISEHRRLRGRMGMLWSEAGPKASYFTPELTALGEETIMGFVDTFPPLETYRFSLSEVFRQAAHVRSDEVEEVLASMGRFAGGAREAYNLLGNAELPWKTITLTNGDEVLINTAGYSLHREAAHRDDRRAVFDAYWTVWNSFRGTVGVLLNNNTQRNVFNARVRNYPSVLEMELFDDNLPAKIYHQLVRQANKHLPLLHRAFDLRRRMLGLEEMRYYDIYPDLVQIGLEFPIEKSIDLTIAAAAPLGEEYVSLLTEALSERTMHVFPSTGKRSGAYASGGPHGEFPFIFLNHDDTYGALTTLVHEWGHGMHTILAQKNQPPHLSRYTIFIAEIAAIVNEILLQEKLIAAATTPEEEIFYLGQALEQMRGTFFRQTKFAEFEERIHRQAEAGVPLDGDSLKEIYLELLRAYHGHDEGIVYIDELYGMEWAFVPHFYNSFYVYKYATSITAAAAFAERLQSGDPVLREQYLDVLRAGGNGHPHDILLAADMDLSQPDPYLALMKRMEQLMDRLDDLITAKGM